MENHGVQPSPINTEDDLLAHISIVYGAMHQYMAGDRDRELLVSIATQFRVIAESIKKMPRISTLNMVKSKKQVKFIAESLFAVAKELTASGEIPNRPNVGR